MSAIVLIMCIQYTRQALPSDVDDAHLIKYNPNTGWICWSQWHWNWKLKASDMSIVTELMTLGLLVLLGAAAWLGYRLGHYAGRRATQTEHRCTPGLDRHDRHW
jgi:hypothetical protein